MDFDLIQGTDSLLARLTPPQTKDAGITAGNGAYCFVIDVSGSMNAAASVTTDDGDKVNHGWSQLDIAKHSTNTFVASLSDGDYVSVVTYSDAANVLLDWTRCDDAGREVAIQKIHSMRPERSTNLMAGITTGFNQFDKLPEPNEALPGYALNLVITTDGMPSSQWHPARGRDGYAPLVKTLGKTLSSKRGAAGCPVVTSIGIGFQLDSELLTSFSETFLHMPDPGQIGPFIVNLLAAVRSTARLPDPSGVAASRAALVVSPASALADGLEGVPGYGKLAERVGDTIRVPLGAVLYDQPRHVLLRTKPGAPALTTTLEVNGSTTAHLTSADAKQPGEAELLLLQAQEMRLRAVEAIHATLEACNNVPLGRDEVPGDAPMRQFITSLRASPVASDPSVTALGNTLEAEVILGAETGNFRRWGAHYMRTLPIMLRTERRSNFRDEALQHFGKDAQGREALFEEESNQAEMRFATLAPPEPSLLNRPTPQPVAGVPLGNVATLPPQPRMALPDEFMRGGGCFGPTARVSLALRDGSSRSIPVAEVRAGDVLIAADGRAAPVRCVVLTECEGGRAMLTRLPNGLEITEWHPVLDGDGRWRFPIMLGQRVITKASHVYNFVLAPGHPAVLVNGVACAALGHGLDAPTVAHPYWGTQAVIEDLMTKPGWSDGRVLLPARREA